MAIETKLPLVIDGIEAGRGSNAEESIVEYVRGKQTIINALIIDPATLLGLGLTGDTVILNIYEDHRKRTEAEGGPTQVGVSDDGVLATVTAAASTSSVAVFTIADSDVNFNNLLLSPNSTYYGSIRVTDSSDSSRLKYTEGFRFKIR